MANARKPDNVHKLNGTYQIHRHGEPGSKPKWDESFPEMPDTLDEDAQIEWERIRSIVPKGVITLTDRAALTQYCVLWSELVKDPLKFPSSKHAQLKLVQQELGFTPCSRGKIGGAPKQQDDDGPVSIPR